MDEKELSIDNIGTEKIYSLLKQKCEKIKNENKLLIEKNLLGPNNFGFSKEEIKNAIKYIPFSEKTIWNFSTFATSLNKNNIEYPEILSNSWTETILNETNGINITNKIFECEECIDYRIVNNLIKANILLKGESSFWVFLHLNHEFDDKTIAVVFSKKEYSQRVSMSLGSFVNLDNINSSKEKQNNFFIFQKQQLIKNYKLYNTQKRNDKYEVNDVCTIKITIFDEGYNKIKIIAKLNENEEENELIGKICSQVANINNIEQKYISDRNEDKYRIMIAGNGSFCKVNNFYCETKLKSYIENNKLEIYGGCNCCNIF